MTYYIEYARTDVFCHDFTYEIREKRTGWQPWILAPLFCALGVRSPACWLLMLSFGAIYASVLNILISSVFFCCFALFPVFGVVYAVCPCPSILFVAKYWFITLLRH